MGEGDAYFLIAWPAAPSKVSLCVIRCELLFELRSPSLHLGLHSRIHSVSWTLPCPRPRAALCAWVLLAFVLGLDFLPSCSPLSIATIQIANSFARFEEAEAVLEVRSVI